jgi:hypothetical protein
MSALDTQIDDLYARPLAEFTASRNALAKTLKGDEASQVKRLEKPSVVAWAVNQLYWQERRTWDRLLAAGQALRDTQIAALSGTEADLRAASTAHHAALADAIATASQLTAQSGVRPASEPLSRMLEAISLAQALPVQPGRFVDVMQPAGFEALAGLSVLASQAASPRPTRAAHTPTHTSARTRPDPAAERLRVQEAAAARRRAEAAVTHAARRLEQATTAVSRAEAVADGARQQLARADAALRAARDEAARASEDVAQANAALAALPAARRS